MKRIALTLLFLALGAAAQILLRDASRSEISAAPRSSESGSAIATAATIRSDLRAQFLTILNSPSGSRRAAGFHRFALETPSEHLELALEAIHPEGWTRHHGDLQIALMSELAQRAPQRLARVITSLPAGYPDTKDNLPHIALNLGYLNPEGALEAFTAIGDEDFNRNLKASFVKGLSLTFPAKVFRAELLLLGPDVAYESVHPDSLPDALQTFWENADAYREQSVTPGGDFLFEFGRTFGPQCIERLGDARTTAAGLVVGIALTPDWNAPAVKQNLQNIDSIPGLPSYRIPDSIPLADAQTALQRLASLTPDNEALLLPAFRKLWTDGITQHTAQQILADADATPTLKTAALAHGAHLLEPAQLFTLLPAFEPDTRDLALQTLIAETDAQDRSLLFNSLPADWVTSSVLKHTLDVALETKDWTTLAALKDHTASLAAHSLNLRHYQRASLWRNAPELYLQTLSHLSEHAQSNHLSHIARIAAPDEIPLLLEQSSLSQQTDVLIELAGDRPELVLPILADESGTELSFEQARRLGFNLQTDVAPFLKTRDLTQAPNRTLLLAAMSADTPVAFDPTTHPTHHYIAAVSAALRGEIDAPEKLEQLRHQNPELFFDTLKRSARVRNLPQHRQRTAAYLKSAALTPEQRLELHSALYGHDAL